MRSSIQENRAPLLSDNEEKFQQQDANEDLLNTQSMFAKSQERGYVTEVISIGIDQNQEMSLRKLDDIDQDDEGVYSRALANLDRAISPARRSARLSLSCGLLTAALIGLSVYGMTRIPNPGPAPDPREEWDEYNHYLNKEIGYIVYMIMCSLGVMGLVCCSAKSAEYALRYFCSSNNTEVIQEKSAQIEPERTVAVDLINKFNHAHIVRIPIENKEYNSFALIKGLKEAQRQTDRILRLAAVKQALFFTDSFRQMGDEGIIDIIDQYAHPRRRSK